MSIILASSSPRRYELFKMIGINDFIVMTDTSAEEIRPGLTPEQAVCDIALQKAKNVFNASSAGMTDHNITCDDIIIAADTLVYLDNDPLGKPASPDEAVRMLSRLSGRRHTVFTGVALLQGSKAVTAAEKTDVYFREISQNEINAYVDTGEPMDKAGSYAAQGRGALFIERIEGEFFNVMGLPLCRLSLMLREFGIIL